MVSLDYETCGGAGRVSHAVGLAIITDKGVWSFDDLIGEWGVIEVVFENLEVDFLFALDAIAWLVTGSKVIKMSLLFWKV